VAAGNILFDGKERNVTFSDTIIVNCVRIFAINSFNAKRKMESNSVDEI